MTVTAHVGNALSQASRVGHECALNSDKLLQQATTLSRGLLAGDVEVLDAGT